VLCGFAAESTLQRIMQRAYKHSVFLRKISSEVYWQHLVLTRIPRPYFKMQHPEFALTSADVAKK
jgi:hypothetical protein